MLFCDIDRFKPYSDQYGHKVGDQVIKVVARSPLPAGQGEQRCRIVLLAPTA